MSYVVVMAETEAATNKSHIYSQASVNKFLVCHIILYIVRISFKGNKSWHSLSNNKICFCLVVVSGVRANLILMKCNANLICFTNMSKKSVFKKTFIPAKKNKILYQIWCIKKGILCICAYYDYSRHGAETPPRANFRLNSSKYRKYYGNLFHYIIFFITPLPCHRHQHSNICLLLNIYKAF